jgi:hypothetical protein
MAHTIVLLQLALSLLIAAQGPHVPQTLRDQAVFVAKLAISQATTINAVTGTGNETVVLNSSTTTPEKTYQSEVRPLVDELEKIWADFDSAKEGIENCYRGGTFILHKTVDDTGAVKSFEVLPCNSAIPQFLTPLQKEEDRITKEISTLRLRYGIYAELTPPYTRITPFITMIENKGAREW